MGATPSVNLPIPPNFNYFCLGFGHTDRLRLIYAPQDVLDRTESVLTSTWPIQDVHKTQGFAEYKLKGNPWYTYGESDLNVKYFVCALLKQYYELGWYLAVSADLQRVGNDSSSLIFQRGPPLSTFTICLSLNGTDRIRVLGPQDLIPTIRQTIIQCWPAGIQREQMFDKSLEFKLKGNPWSGWISESSDSFYSRILINEILSSLFQIGWIFCGSVDTNKREDSLNALYFRYAPEETKNSPSNFFAIDLGRTDRVRLLRATPEIFMAIKNAMPQIWPLGIQKEKELYNSYEFKLKGNPWSSNGIEAVESRRLITNLFAVLSTYGWQCYAVCDLSRQVNSKSSFYFQLKPNTTVRPSRFLSLSPTECDKIRIINGDETTNAIVRNAIVQSWSYGIQNEGFFGNSWQFKLNGYPFQCMGEQAIICRVMMMHILSVLQSYGIRFLASADVSGKFTSDNNGNSHSIDLHSFFFVSDL